MMTVVIRAFVLQPEEGDADYEKTKDPSWRMLIPLYIFAVGCVLFGLYSGPVVDYFTQIAEGLL